MKTLQARQDGGDGHLENGPRSSRGAGVCCVWIKREMDVWMCVCVCVFLSFEDTVFCGWFEGNKEDHQDKGVVPNPNGQMTWEPPKMG